MMNNNVGRAVKSDVMQQMGTGVMCAAVLRYRLSRFVRFDQIQ